jgi:acetylglutamate kinase
MTPIVVKIGGSLMENRASLDALCDVLALRAGPQNAGGLVLCHGGGKDISRNLQWLGEEPRFKDGLRVTSPEAMGVVEMTLSGAVNKALVRLLQRHGTAACGISGVDGPTLLCRPLDPELGQVGAVSEVRPALVTTLLHAGYVPVVSPVSVDANQASFNVNADDAASALAAALKAGKLLFISDVPGVLDENTRILPRLDRADIEALIARGAVSGGMIPKLRSCAQAVQAGVGEVHICGFDSAAALAAQIEGSANTGTIVSSTN